MDVAWALYFVCVAAVTVALPFRLGANLPSVTLIVIVLIAFAVAVVQVVIALGMRQIMEMGEEAICELSVSQGTPRVPGALLVTPSP